MDRYKFYDDDDWNNIDLENDINYEESYRGFKIVRMEDGHYEIYRLGRKRNVYMLDSGFPDNFENNQYEKKIQRASIRMELSIRTQTIQKPDRHRIHKTVYRFFLLNFSQENSLRGVF